MASNLGVDAQSRGALDCETASPPQGESEDPVEPPGRGPRNRPLLRTAGGFFEVERTTVVADERRTLRRPLRVRATPFEQRDLEVLGLRLRYIDVGPTDPRNEGAPLLLIHGHTSRIEEYDELVPHLAEHHRVLVCDLPGCGYSDKPENQRYDLELYEGVLLGFLDALRVREARLAGGSLGGNLTLRLGYRVPDRFERLVAWAPAGAWRPARWAAKAMRAFGNGLLFWPSVWGQSRFWYERSWPRRNEALAETFAYYREVVCPGFVRMYWDVAADQISKTHFDYAHAIRQPTLLAWGDRDHALNMGAGVRQLHALMPCASLRVFEGARHSLANEIPEDLARVANEFLLAEDADISASQNSRHLTPN